MCFFALCQCSDFFKKIKSRWIFRHQKELLEILNTVLLKLTNWHLLTRGLIIKHNHLFHQRKLCLPKIWSPTSIKWFHTTDILLKTAVCKENKWDLICHKMNCTIYFSWGSHAFVTSASCNSFALKRSISFYANPRLIQPCGVFLQKKQISLSRTWWWELWSSTIKSLISNMSPT